MSTLKTINLQHLNGTNPNIYLSNTGNVGIGNSSPQSKLTIDGEVFLGRENTSNEGGQISFGRASDNAQHYYIDCYGAGSTPSMRFIDAPASVVRMTIDSSGRVTKPFQPAFRAYSTAGSYSTTGVDIVFGSTNYNIGNYYNTSNGRFTAPVSGVYHIIWSTSSFGAAGFSLDLHINGNAQAYSEQNNSLTYFVTGQSQLRYLNAGDYATLRLRFGTINLAEPSTNFQAFLVS